MLCRQDVCLHLVSTGLKTVPHENRWSINAYWISQWNVDISVTLTDKNWAPLILFCVRQVETNS